MNLKSNTLKGLLFSTLLGLSLNASADTLKVGGRNGPSFDLLVAAQKVAKEKYHLDVELIGFDDYVTPNIALADGDIDLNAFQHRPYLNRMVADRGFKLAVVGDTFVYPINAYSKRYKSIADLPKGASIAVPNDPSNEARTLIIMAKKGLIELEDINNLEASILDITKNPNEYNFKEIDAAQLPRMLDEVDLVFINNNYAVSAGISTKSAILTEGTDSPYMNVIVARQADTDKQSIKDFVKSFQSDAVKAAADKAYKGSAVPGW